MELNATLLIQAAIVLVLMAWLSPVLFGPLLKVFDEREKRIHGAAEEARKRLGSADEKSALVEQKTKEAQAQARLILTGIREQAKAKEAQLLDKAREDAALRLEDARAELFDATEAARRALKDDARGIADAIVQKVLGRAA
jgi:F-type H+-transporting ATPase subunit b